MWWRFRKHQPGHGRRHRGDRASTWCALRRLSRLHRSRSVRGPALADAAAADPLVRRLAASPARLCASRARAIRRRSNASTGRPGQQIPSRFFAQGFEYKFFGLIPTTATCSASTGADAAKTLFLLGTDVQGRDLWSRLLYATRISLTIGLVGVTLSLVLGVLLGGLSGFYGGHGRHAHPARHRDSALDPDHPAVDGPGGGVAARLVRPAGLFRHHDHHLADRLDRAGTRRARALPGPARGGFRHGGAAGRLQPDAHHLRAHGAHRS